MDNCIPKETGEKNANAGIESERKTGPALEKFIVLSMHDFQ